MTRSLCALIVCVASLSASFAFQKQQKPWTEWSQKDAEKILSKSPWAQTQTDTDTSEMFFTPTSDPTRGRQTANDESRLARGATNQAVDLKLVVRFFSARPVRRALVRLMELRQKPDTATAERMHSFANLSSSDSIILTLSIESSDQRYTGVAMQTLNSATTGTLKNETYLERDGKRLFLEEYVPPGKDGFGARFVFPRLQDERPFINGNSGILRFYAKYPSGLIVDRTFKISDMLVDGEVEY